MAQLTETGEHAQARPFTSALLVLGGAALFGTVGTAQALGPEVGATALAAARMLLTAILFWLLLLLAGPGAHALSAARSAPVWLAGLGQGFFNLCFLAAMQAAGVAVGTLVAIGATPVVTGLVTRHVSRRWVGATAVAVAGLVLLVLGQQSGPVAPSATGVLLALGAAVSYATYIIAGNAAETRGLDTASFLAVAFAVAAAVTLPWLVMTGSTVLLSPGGATLLGYLVLVPTLLAYSLFNRGLRGVRAGTASTLALIEPVVAAGLALVVLGERLSPAGALGATLILLGLLLVVRSTGDAEKRSDGA